MVRITTFCLLLLLSVGIILPFSNSAHGIRQSAHMVQRHHHSRAWWRRYRARIRRKRAAAALAHRNAMLAMPTNIPVGDLTNVVLSQPTAPVAVVSASQPTPAAVPATTSTTAVAPVASSTNVATLKSKTKATTALPGQMNLAVVAMSRPNPAFLTSREQSRMLAGVAVSDLRRIVIDKMITAGGWVTNDYVREVNGARVFVVTARTPKDAHQPEKAWTFYFTEMGGRIYSLTTDSAVEYSDRMATEAERLINSLRLKAEASK